MRMEQCKALTYDEDLPTLSVIMIFHNEAWSPVMRTAYSVVNRTPPRYLKEVILLDDSSTRPELLKHLDDFLAEKFPDGVVRIVRKSTRQGLIRARLEGAKAATGDVLVFLDAHCEVTEGWAEPLLQRIKDNRRAVLCPAIGSIGANDIGFRSAGVGAAVVGSFWWSLHFTWDIIPS